MLHTIRYFIIMVITYQKIYKYTITYEFTLYLGEITLAKVMTDNAIHGEIKRKKGNLDFLSIKLKVKTLFFVGIKYE